MSVSTAVGNSEHRPPSNATTLSYSECSLCSTSLVICKSFGELDQERLLGCCRQGLDTWKTAARFGYLKDCWFGRRGLKHTQCGATLETDECVHQQHVASQQPGVRIIDMPAAATVYEVSIYCCMHVCMLVSIVVPHWPRASTPKAEVFQVSKPCQ